MSARLCLWTLIQHLVPSTLPWVHEMTHPLHQNCDSQMADFPPARIISHCFHTSALVVLLRSCKFRYVQSHDTCSEANFVFGNLYFIRHSLARCARKVLVDRVGVKKA